jgi:integrase
VLTAEKTKTKRKRLIPIPPTLRKVLDRRKLAPDGTSFRLPPMYLATQLGSPFQDACRIRGGTRPAGRRRSTIGTSDLRHEFGSQVLEAGGELHEVQATLGHTNIKMTSTYLNATTQGVKQAFKKLEAKRRVRASRSFVAREWPATDPHDQAADRVRCVRV